MSTKELNYHVEKSKEIITHIKRMGTAQERFTDLWFAAKSILEFCEGKHDEFVPDDIYTDNLKIALKRSRPYLK